MLTGLLAGVVHVLSGPDHLAAVAPLATEGCDRGIRTGARWGLGHASGVLVVGLAALLVRLWLPVGRFSFISERFVGVALIAVGLWGARRALSLRVHVHDHTHDGRPHRHIHVHGARAAHAHDTPSTHRHGHAAFGIGVLHGFAGSAHFLGVLPALAMPTLGASLSYVLAFGAGTVFAMAGFAGVVAWLAARFDGAGTRTYRGMLVAVSAAAVGVGVFWLAVA